MLELTIGTLRFDWANTGSGVRPDFDCERHEVRAGEEIGPPSHYSITATDASGRPLSLGISPDGHLYAGDFAPTVGCPCRHGN